MSDRSATPSPAEMTEAERRFFLDEEGYPIWETEKGVVILPFGAFDGRYEMPGYDKREPLDIEDALHRSDLFLRADPTKPWSVVSFAGLGIVKGVHPSEGPLYVPRVVLRPGQVLPARFTVVTSTPVGEWPCFPSDFFDEQAASNNLQVFVPRAESPKRKRSPSPPASSPAKRAKPDAALLFQACAEGDAEAVKTLLGKGTVDLNKPVSRGWAPIHIACKSGNVAIVKLLIDSGADLNLKTEEA